MNEPDLQILIHEDHSGGRASLRFMVKARDPGLGLNFEQLGPVSLLVEPRQHFEEVFKEIVKLPLHDADARTDAQTKLEAKGANLTKALLPANLRDLLWELQGKIESIEIQSDEGWIPWELLKLRKRERGRWVSGPFLCEAFALTRWRPGVAEHLHLPFPGDPTWLAYVAFAHPLAGCEEPSEERPSVPPALPRMKNERFSVLFADERLPSPAEIAVEDDPYENARRFARDFGHRRRGPGGVLMVS